MRRTVRWLAWSIGILFVLGTVLQLVDFLNLYATPPPYQPEWTMVDARLATLDYRAAIWLGLALAPRGAADPTEAAEAA